MRRPPGVSARASKPRRRGGLRADIGEVHAWAVMGMNVFPGLRYGVWDEDVAAGALADTVADVLRRGIGAR